MTIGPRPACFACVHFHGWGALGPTCDAFPKQVPDDIYFGQVDHRQPFPGDHGIRWEPAEGVTEYPERLSRVRRGQGG